MKGFTTKDGYAAVPFCNKIMIIFNGYQMGVLKNEEEANAFIKLHRANPETVIKEPKRATKPAKIKTVRD